MALTAPGNEEEGMVRVPSGSESHTVDARCEYSDIG
jgi:hypothetical protein